MAIPILEQRKRLRKLIPILAVVVLITAFNVYRALSKPKDNTGSIVMPVEAKRIEIDWNMIKSKDLENLDLFPEIPELEKEPGRDNPFESY